MLKKTAGFLWFCVTITDKCGSIPRRMCEMGLKKSIIEFQLAVRSIAICMQCMHQLPTLKLSPSCVGKIVVWQSPPPPSHIWVCHVYIPSSYALDLSNDIYLKCLLLDLLFRYQIASELCVEEADLCSRWKGTFGDGRSRAGSEMHSTLHALCQKVLLQNLWQGRWGTGSECNHRPHSCWSPYLGILLPLSS